MINVTLEMEGRIIACTDIDNYTTLEFTTTLYKGITNNIRVIELCISDGKSIFSKASTHIDYKEKSEENLKRLEETLKSVIEKSGVNIGDGKMIYIKKYLSSMKEYFLDNGEYFLDHNIFLSHSDLENSYASFFNIESDKSQVNNIIFEYPSGERKIIILVEPGDRLVNDQVKYVEKKK